MTRFFIGVALGMYLGATLWHRIPHYVGLALADEPSTPVDYKPKHYYYSGGARTDVPR